MTRLIILIAISVSAHYISLQGQVAFPHKPGNGIFVIAHRGAHDGLPENSLQAYQKAIDIGCDFVEIDIRTTRDGKFISFHDPDINDPATGTRGRVKDFDLRQLKALDIGIGYGDRWKGTTIPTLEDILALCRGRIAVYLDLKDASIPDLVSVIRLYGMEKEIIWYVPASDTAKIRALENSCPDCLLMADPGSEKNIRSVHEEFAATLLATDMSRLSRSFVRNAHDYNMMVFTDDKEGTETEWKKIIEWGTDGIQTDNPEKLILFLRNRIIKTKEKIM